MNKHDAEEWTGEMDSALPVPDGRLKQELLQEDLLRRARHWIWLAAPHQDADAQAVAVIDLRAIEEALNLPEAEQRWRQLAGL